MLTIIASMERELSGLRGGDASVQPGRSLNLNVVGVGRYQSRAGLREILKCGSKGTTRALLMLGFAGAVDPGLKTGDMVLSSRYYLEGNGEDFLVPDPAMRQSAIIAAANAGLPVTYLDSLTVDGIISTPAAKAALASDYRVGIVGMEDLWLAEAAGDAGAPFISARVVLDTAQQGLPGNLLGLSRGRALDVLATAAMPWRVPALFRLAYQGRIAGQVLRRFAFSFIRQWASDAPAASNQAVVRVAR